MTGKATGHLTLVAGSECYSGSADALGGHTTLVARFHDIRTRVVSTVKRLRGASTPGEQLTASVDPHALRYVYRVVVEGERDERLLVRDEPARLDDVVPFRGQKAVVERIEETHERDFAGNDLRERVEADPQTQILRTLHCRLISKDGASR